MIKKHFPFIIFFTLFFIVGLFVYQDYGLSWDEPAQRDDNGLVNYNFIKTGDSKQLLESNEKFHGPAYEIFLIGVENIFHLKDSRQIYLMRHLVNFILFSISILFFYFLLIKYFKKWIALAGCVFLVLSPRIFAESFYNSKDIIFLSFSIIAAYTSIIFFEKNKISYAFFHAFFSAILIDIRIMGILFPLFTILFPFYSSKDNSTLIKRKVKNILWYFIFLIPLTIIFWPVLWINPAEMFLRAFNEMKKFHWDENVLFAGRNIPAPELPWYYLPVWIAISTPLQYLALFLTGIFALVRKLILSVRNSFSNLELLAVMMFFIPLISIIIFHSVVYDSWRHVYFTYPFFIIISLTGLNFIYDSISAVGKKVVIAGVLACTIYTLYIQVYFHPYENVYFNKLAGENYSSIKNNYEMDYWGLSYLEGLKYISMHDSSQNIFINAATPPGEFSLKILKKKDRDRFHISDYIHADYFLTSYRGHPQIYNLPTCFEIRKENVAIMSVFDLRKEKQQLLTDVDTENVFSENYYPVNYHMKSTQEYFPVYETDRPDTLSRNNNHTVFILKVVTWNNSDYNFATVFQYTHSKTDAPFEWNGSDGNTSFLSINDTTLQYYEMPEKMKSGESLKIYLWNNKKSDFLIKYTELKTAYIPTKELNSFIELFK